MDNGFNDRGAYLCAAQCFSCLAKFRVAAGLSSVNYVILEMEVLSQHPLLPQ